MEVMSRDEVWPPGEDLRSCVRKPWRFWSALKLAECSYFRNIVAKRLDQGEKLFLNKEDCRPGIIQNVAQFADASRIFSGSRTAPASSTP